MYTPVTEQTTAQLSLVESQIRRKLAFALKKTESYKSHGNIDAIIALFDPQPTYIMVQTLYFAGRQYEEIQEIEDEISNGTGRTEAQFAVLAEYMKDYSYVCNEEPFIDLYTDFLTSVNDLIYSEFPLAEEPEDSHDIIGQLMGIQLDYARKCVERFDTWRDTDWSIFANQTYDSRWKPKSDNETTKYSVDTTAFAKELQRLRDYLVSVEARIAVTKYILSGTIGSYAIDLIPDISFPLFVSVLPAAFVEMNYQSFWSYMNYDDHDHIALGLEDAKTYDETDLQHLDELFLQSLNTRTMHKHNTRQLRRATLKKDEYYADQDTPSTPKASHPRPPFDHGTSGNQGQRKKKTKKQPPPPKGPDSSGGQSSQGQQQPAIPDDDDYSPDWMLVKQVKYQIQDIKDTTPFPDYFDHMTHFNTHDERPVSVLSSKVTNRDLKVFKGNSLLDGYYIVTFTRKSRKPIFNPVI